MQTPPVIDLLEKASDRPARRGDIAIVAPVDFLLFEGFHEALRFGVVVGVADPAHARLDAVRRQFAGVVLAGVLPGLKWSSQHFEGEVAMTGRRRRSDRSGRAPLFSPGRPVVAGRDQQRRFWAAIAAGMASEDAAVQAGMSQAVGTRLFRKAGGMPPAMFRPSVKPLAERLRSSYKS